MERNHPLPCDSAAFEKQDFWLRGLLACLCEAAILTDREGRVLLLNEAAQSLLGCEEGAVGKRVDDLFQLQSETTRQAVENPVMGLLREGASGKQENQTLLITRAGAAIPIDHCSNLVLDREGAVRGAILILRNTLQRRRDEEERARCTAITESCEDAILGKTVEGIIVHWNPAAQRLYGYSAEEIKGRSISLLMPPESSEELPGIMARICRGERVRPYETVRVRKDGTRIHVSVSISPIQDTQGRVIGATAIARDISEFKREQVALREREEMVRLLLESTGEGIYGLDRQSHCTFCNPACLRLLGFTDAAQLLGKNLHHLSHHTRADGTRYPIEDCRILQALRRGEGVHVEDEVLWRADGTCFPAEYWSYPVRREGEVVGVVVTFVDRTERRKAEQALRASEERFRQLAENIEEVFWLTDVPVSEMIYVSPAYERVWGRGCQSLYEQPRSFLDAVHPEDRDHVAESILGERREQGFTEEFRIVRPDGSIRWVCDRGFPIRDENGRVYRMAGTAVDITARKQVEERLAYQAQLLDEVNDAIIATDTERRITSWNRAAERMYGWTAEEVMGQDISQVIAANATDTAREQVLREILEQGVWKGEGVHRRRNGQKMVVDWSIKVICDMAGEVTGAVAINRDITQLKESQRLALQAERLAAIGQVVTGIAHESRNALQGIQASLERLARKLQDQPAALDLVDRAQKEQDRLLRLYEDVRRYAAPIQLEPGECRLDEVWQSAWRQLAEAVSGRQVALVEEVNGVNLRCTVDSFRLEQVFRNVFDNALAACRDPVRIEVHCIATRLGDRPAIRVAVRDNGPGLTAEQQQKMFEPFYTTKTKGTGLGLAISKRLVEAHGGHITTGVGTGRGAEIILTLPRSVS